jgi:hypothetical protein
MPAHIYAIPFTTEQMDKTLETYMRHTIVDPSTIKRQKQHSRAAVMPVAFMVAECATNSGHTVRAHAPDTRSAVALTLSAPGRMVAPTLRTQRSSPWIESEQAPDLYRVVEQVGLGRCSGPLAIALNDRGNDFGLITRARGMRAETAQRVVPDT